MGPLKMLRYLVIALLAAGILLTAGSSMASSQDPAAAIVGRTGQPTMTGGGYALIYHFQRCGRCLGQPVNTRSWRAAVIINCVAPRPTRCRRQRLLLQMSVCLSSEKSSISHPLLDRTQRLTEDFCQALCLSTHLNIAPVLPCIRLWHHRWFGL